MELPELLEVVVACSATAGTVVAALWAKLSSVDRTTSSRVDGVPKHVAEALEPTIRAVARIEERIDGVEATVGKLRDDVELLFDAEAAASARDADHSARLRAAEESMADGTIA